MAGRPKIYDNREVINKAIQVFWTKGYEAASADELLEAMGIGKGSFYLAFKGGKQELYEKSLEQFSEVYAGAFSNAAATTEDPIGLVKDFFFSRLQEPKARQSRGCYLGNALVEMSGVNRQVRDLAKKLLTETEQQFVALIRQAQEKKQMHSTENPEVLGRYLINLWNGLNVTRRMHATDATLQQMLELSLKVLD